MLLWALLCLASSKRPRGLPASPVHVSLRSGAGTLTAHLPRDQLCCPPPGCPLFTNSGCTLVILRLLFSTAASSLPQPNTLGCRRCRPLEAQPWGGEDF